MAARAELRDVVPGRLVRAVAARRRAGVAAGAPQPPRRAGAQHRARQDRARHAAGQRRDHRCECHATIVIMIIQFLERRVGRDFGWSRLTPDDYCFLKSFKLLLYISSFVITT